jgi:hypothetical protein
VFVAQGRKLRRMRHQEKAALIDRLSTS